MGNLRVTRISASPAGRKKIAHRFIGGYQRVGSASPARDGSVLSSLKGLFLCPTQCSALRPHYPDYAASRRLNTSQALDSGSRRAHLEGTTSPGGQKSEGRNPKSERNPKAEIRMAAGDGEVMLVSCARIGAGWCGAERYHLLISDFGFRISGFAFGRLALAATVEIRPDGSGEKEKGSLFHLPSPIFHLPSLAAHTLKLSAEDFLRIGPISTRGPSWRGNETVRATGIRPLAGNTATRQRGHRHTHCRPEDGAVRSEEH